VCLKKCASVVCIRVQVCFSAIIVNMSESNWTTDSNGITGTWGHRYSSHYNAWLFEKRRLWRQFGIHASRTVTYAEGIMIKSAFIELHLANSNRPECRITRTANGSFYRTWHRRHVDQLQFGRIQVIFSKRLRISLNVLLNIR
jgi:hypothetical protein